MLTKHVYRDVCVAAGGKHGETVVEVGVWNPHPFSSLPYFHGGFSKQNKINNDAMQPFRNLRTPLETFYPSVTDLCRQQQEKKRRKEGKKEKKKRALKLFVKTHGFSDRKLIAFTWTLNRKYYNSPRDSLFWNFPFFFLWKIFKICN